MNPSSTQEKSRFKHFFKLGAQKFEKTIMGAQAFDKKVKEEQDAQRLIELKASFQKDVDLLIVNGDAVNLGVAIQKGYQITPQQSMEILFKHDIFTLPVIESALCEVFRSGFKQKIHAYQQALEQVKPEEKKTYSDRKEYASHQRKQLADYANATWPYLGMKYVSEQSKDDALLFLEVLQEMRTHKIEVYCLFPFNNRHREHITVATKKFEKNADDYIFKVKHHYKDHLSNQFMGKLDQYKDLLNLEGMKKTIAQDFAQNIVNFREKDLPKPCQSVIREINQIYGEIDTGRLSLVQQLDLDTLYKKRFPQVIEEYITISPRYREKLMHHKENVDVLLLEGLNEVKKGVSQIFEQLQDSHVTNLKVTHRYLKSK